MMPDLLEMERHIARIERELATWRRDTATRPIRESAPGGVIGHVQLAVVRDIGAGTETYIKVQRLRQINSAPGWAYASATYEQVACYGDLVANEYKSFVCTVPGDWVPNQRCTVIPLLRGNLSWVAFPWTAREMIDIADLVLVARTDCYPPIGGGGRGVPTPSDGDGDGALPPADFDSLTDVTISGDQANGEIAVWNEALTQWINQTLAEAGIASLVHAARHQVGGADVVQTAICEVSATPPAVAAVGQLWYDTSATGSSVSSTENIVTKTANYTLTANDVIVLANGTLTLTLPTAVGISGKGYKIKNIGTGRVTVACDGSETIEEAPTAVLPPKVSIFPRSDNTEWWIL